MWKRITGAALAGAGLACWTASAAAQLTTWQAPPEARAVKRPTSADDKSLERGKRLFKQNCVPCHGELGRGDGPMAKALGVQPGNLANAERMRIQTEGEIFWKISKGKEPMPIFERKLSTRARWDLVGYVRTLAR